MKNVKHIFCAVLCLVLLLSALPAFALNAGAAQAVSSGSCGKNVKWTLDADGLLTISGTGAMKDYANTTVTPFYQNHSVKAVSILPGITHIGKYAFSYCDTLAKVSVPDSVKSIGAMAFYGCKKLAALPIPDSVTEIGSSAFEETAWYEAQPEGLYYAGKVACGFKGDMPENTEIVIREGTKGIADDAFEICETLTAVTLPDSVETIGAYAFWRCGISEIRLPESLKTIGESAFNECYDISEISIPESVTKIGASAFSDTKITELRIPAGVTEIGGNPAPICSNLTSITVAEGNPAYRVAGNCLIETGTKKLVAGCKTSVIPADGSVTQIGNCAFMFSGLQEVTLPEGLETIGDSAFLNTFIEKIDIPDSVTKIGSFAFYQCNELTEIVLPADLEEIGEDVFMNTIHYPGSREQWAQVYFNGWAKEKETLESQLVFHALTPGEVLQPSTCTEQGRGRFYCADLDKTVTKNLPYLEHTDQNNDGACDTCKGDMEIAVCRPAFGKDSIIYALDPANAKCFTRGRVFFLSANLTMDEVEFRFGFRPHWWGVGDFDFEEVSIATLGVFDDYEVFGSYSINIFGDMTHDNKITAADARFALRCVVGLEPDLDVNEKLGADVNFDNRITASDARMLLRAAVGLEQSADWIPD